MEESSRSSEQLGKNLDCVTKLLELVKKELLEKTGLVQELQAANLSLEQNQRGIQMRLSHCTEESALLRKDRDELSQEN